VPNPVQFDVTAGALPEGLDTDPQGLLQEFAARLIITPSVPWSSFTVGAAQPTSNVGPWFKDGQELWVWSDVAATYIPVVSAAVLDANGGSQYPTLRYAVSSLAPDPIKYSFWIELNGAGKAINIKHYSSGAWKSIFEDTFAGIQTQFTNITTNYSTTTQMNTAIATAVDAVRINYPVSASLAVSQTVNISNLATNTKLLFNTVTLDPDSAYDATNSRFVAPVNGIYQVSAELQVDNNTGVAASMEMALTILKNSGNYTASGMAIASPPGARWYPQVSSLVQLGVGDIVEIALSLDDGTNTGNVSVAASNSTADFVLIRKL
jgi:hypothetical protein